MVISNLILIISSILSGMTLILIVFLVNFYRNPSRKIPEGNAVVSPADGKIISITTLNTKSTKVKKGYLGKIYTYTKDVADKVQIITIFMSPLDVHYNRSPVKGTVISVKHTKGKFFKAYDLEKSLLNEKNEVLLQHKKFKVKVIQIAGFLARRIQCFVKENQKVDKGGFIGRIVLGSQATLIIPASLKITCEVGEKVKAGTSILATYEA